MKKMLLKLAPVLLAVSISALVLVIAGCAMEDRSAPDYGDNLLTEASILAATGTGNTIVTKDGDRYKITGNISYDVDGEFDGITVVIMADPEDSGKYFAQVDRYTITCTFPDGAIKPNDTYGSGFDMYLENIKATDNTDRYAGNWQSVPMDEYNAIKGVGTMTVEKNLADYTNANTNQNNVGDYHHMVIRVKFPAANLGSNYTFYISNVAIFGTMIDDTYPGKETPIIHANSILNDESYTVGETAAALRIVSAYQGPVGDTVDSRTLYTYQWYSNTTNSTTDGTLIPEDQIGDNNDYPGGWQDGTSYIPPTDTAGVFYYYVVVTSQDDISVTSRVVTITVTE